MCSGESHNGDISLDLFKKATVKGDMFHLPFLNNSFDTVICDPPWNLPYHLRMRLHFRLRDVLKAGGKLIFNAPWVPYAKGLIITEYWVRVHHPPWINVGLITIAVKKQTQLDSYCLEKVLA